MSKYLVEKYINDLTIEILEKSNECKMYNIGAATGYYHMLKTFRPLIGEDFYNNFISEWKKETGEIQKYFTKLIELDKLENTKTEDIAEKFDAYKRLRNRENEDIDRAIEALKKIKKITME